MLGVFSCIFTVGFSHQNVMGGSFSLGSRADVFRVFRPQTDGFTGVLDLDVSDRCCALLGLLGVFPLF